MKVVGIGELRKGNFNGFEYESRSIYCTYPSDKVEGLATYRLSVSSKIDITGLKIGCEISPSYNRYGRLEKLNIE